MPNVSTISETQALREQVNELQKSNQELQRSVEDLQAIAESKQLEELPASGRKLNHVCILHTGPYETYLNQTCNLSFSVDYKSAAKSTETKVIVRHERQ